MATPFKYLSLNFTLWKISYEISLLQDSFCVQWFYLKYYKVWIFTPPCDVWYFYFIFITVKKIMHHTSVQIFISNLNWVFQCKGVLRDARTTLCALILSLSSLTRVTSKTSSRCCIFFNIYLELSKNSPFLVKTRPFFTNFTTKNFKQKLERWIFILVKIFKKCFRISMLKSITHWVSS